MAGTKVKLSKEKHLEVARMIGAVDAVWAKVKVALAPYADAAKKAASIDGVFQRLRADLNAKYVREGHATEPTLLPYYAPVAVAATAPEKSADEDGSPEE